MVFLWSVTTDALLTQNHCKNVETLLSRTLTEDTHCVMSPLHVATRLDVETLPIITIFRRLYPTSTISETGPNVTSYWPVTVTNKENIKTDCQKMHTEIYTSDIPSLLALHVLGIQHPLAWQRTNVQLSCNSHLCSEKRKCWLFSKFVLDAGWGGGRGVGGPGVQLCDYATLSWEGVSHCTMLL